MIGRGRGRGRGLVAKQGEQKVGQQNGYASSQSPTSSTIPPQKSPSIANHAPSQLISEQKSSLTVQEIVKSIERMSVSETVKKIPEQLDKIKSPENFETFVTLICEKSLEDPDYAKTSAVLLNELWNHSELNSLIKKPLLTHVQQRYTKRGELKKVKFYGLCVLVCELFRLLRIKDRPLSPLIAAVCQLLKELMKDGEKSTGEDVLYFYQEVESIGDILEKSNEKELEEIINIARQAVISADMLPSVRCRLVQLIELSASGWKMSDELKLFYEDLQQDLMAEGK